jgi:tetratricopeptide (TPR) repeat protein
MSSDVREGLPAAEEQLAGLLAAYDEALKQGAALPPVEVGTVVLPGGMAADWERAQACVRLLEDVWPRGQPTPPAAAPAALAPAVLARLGRFEVRRELGRGGFGTVYLARDPNLGREVALKVPHPGVLADVELQKRFQQEARAAAALDHPNVVPVYEAGEIDGVSYIALAYCAGTNLADWLMQRSEPVPCAAAADLVATLAGAVQHAHEQGIVHRDLKPANVLLQGKGQPTTLDAASEVRHELGALEPRITDFGLARLLASPAAQTRTGTILGTPSYMAPEQAGVQGAAIGVAADVYSLGAILYHVLTGRPPFLGETLLEALHHLRFLDPITPRQLRAGLPRDLETICLKCLDKEPARRYPSARELADDLRRFVDGQPIQARPVGAVGRGVKWTRRRPAAAALVGVSVLAVLGLVVLSGVAIWQWQTAVAALHRAEQTEETATANLERAEDNLKLAQQAVDGTFNVAKEHPLFQEPGMKKARNLLLRQTLPFYKNFSSQRPDDRDLQHEEAKQWFRVGYIEWELLRTQDARQAYERARVLFEALVKAQPDVLSYQQNLALTHNNLGNLLRELGKREEALVQHRQAGELRQQLVKAQPELHEYQNDLASTHHNLGLLLKDLGKHDEALLEYRQAYDLRQKLVKAQPELHEYQDDLATMHKSLGLLLRELGKREQALKEYGHACDLLQKLVQAHPNLPRYQQHLATTLNDLGVLLYEMGKREQALVQYRQARDLGQKLVKDHPDLPVYKYDLALTHNNLGVLLRALGKREQALVEYRQARDLLQKPVKDHPEVLEYANVLASTHHNLGNLLTGLGKHDQALKEYRQAGDLHQKLVKAQPKLPAFQNALANTHNCLGFLLAEMGNGARARQEYEQARDIQSKLVKAHANLPNYRISLAGTCCNLGNLLRDRGEVRQSLNLFTEAIDLLQAVRQRQPDNPMARLFLCNSHWGRALALNLLGRHRDAAVDWDHAILLNAGALLPFLRLRRADSRARAGDYRSAAAEADDLGRAAVRGATLYDLARIHALNAERAGGDASRPLAERDKQSEQYAQAAVALLRRAAATGYFGNSAKVTHLDKEADLAVLRGRSDYQRFRAALKPAGR